MQYQDKPLVTLAVHGVFELIQNKTKTLLDNKTREAFINYVWKAKWKTEDGLPGVYFKAWKFELKVIWTK